MIFRMVLLSRFGFVVLVLAAFSGCVQGNAKAGRMMENDDATPLSTPFILTKRSVQPLVLSGEDVERIRQLSHPLPERMTASLMLHVLHAHALETKFNDPVLTDGKNILKLFTSDIASREYFGDSIVTRTRDGIRCAVSPQVGATREYHRDQALAVFAEMGLPLSTPFEISGQVYSLRDMLEDSIKNYSDRQLELEWTAFAYAIYLPSVKSWTNKYGQVYNFDQLAQAVIDRPLERGSCAGCHLIGAMIALLRVDQERTRVLSSYAREALSKRLRLIVQAALDSQATDGSWGTDWHSSLSSSSSTSIRLRTTSPSAERLVATSHIPEWMLCLPEDMRVPDEVIHHAGIWLYRQWKDVDDKGYVAENFCPCSHAAVVLSAICGSEGQQVEPANSPIFSKAQ